METQIDGLNSNSTSTTLIEHSTTNAVNGADWIQHVNVSDVSITAMFQLTAGLIAFMGIIFLLFERIHNRHNIILDKFVKLGEVEEIDVRQIVADTKTLTNYIRHHNYSTISSLLVGLILLVMYDLHLIDNVGIITMIFGISSFKLIIILSLTPVAVFSVCYNIKIYRLYKKWAKYLTGPYQWF